MPGKRRWQLVGLLAMIGLIIVVFALFVDLQAVAAQLQTAVLSYLLLASAIFIVGLVAYAARWRLLLDNKPSLLNTFHASNVGHAGNILIPARAGEAARIVVMSRSRAVSVTEATSSFVVERLFEQIMRLVALGGAVLYGVGLEVSVGTAVGGLGFLLLAFAGIAWLVNHRERVQARGPGWLAKLPRISEERASQWLNDLLANLSQLASPGKLALVLFWSLAIWICFGAFFYLTLLALGSSFPPEVKIAVSLGALALSPPSAPTQPGVFHASVVAPLTAVGFNAASLTAYAVLIHILEMVWMIGLALWGLLQTGLSPSAILANRAG